MTMRVPATLLTVALTIGALAGCSSSGSSGSAASTAGSAVAHHAPTAAAGGTAKPVDACTLVTAADLSAAAGVTYTKIVSANLGSSCNVTGADEANSFLFSVNKEDSALNSWKATLATVKEDDGSYTEVAGIGDRAIQGAIKEFDVEAKGYIVDIFGGDVNNQATAKDFTHTKSVAKLLVSKL